MRITLKHGMTTPDVIYNLKFNEHSSARETAQADAIAMRSDEARRAYKRSFLRWTPARRYRISTRTDEGRRRLRRQQD